MSFDAGFNAFSLLGSIFDFGYNIFNNERNYSLTEQQVDNEERRYIETRDYNRALQERVFEREDSAIQRAVQDAGKAGFSPLTVAGNGASSGAVVGSSYQSPAGQQVGFTPSSALTLMRGLQEMQLAQDANDRAERETESNIAFKAATLENEKDRLGMDFLLRNAELFNSYSLASEQLKLQNEELKFSKRKHSNELGMFEKELLLNINRLKSDNMKFFADFERQGVWRAEDIEREENRFKWQKGNDTSQNLMNLGNLLVDILGVLNGGNRR